MVRKAVEILTERAGPQVTIRIRPEIVWRDSLRRP